MGQKDITTKDYMKDRSAARVVSSVTGVEFVEDDEEEKVDMCQALKEMIEDGRQEGAQEIARRMLKEGGLSIDFIARMTGLPPEEVQALAVDA